MEGEGEELVVLKGEGQEGGEIAPPGTHRSGVCMLVGG